MYHRVTGVTNTEVTRLARDRLRACRRDTGVSVWPGPVRAAPPLELAHVLRPAPGRRLSSVQLSVVSTDQLSLFFGLLALGALALGPIVLIAGFVLRRDPRQEALRPLLLPLAFVVAATAMAGSLYYSESAGYTPCLYCWYQRICMYPLAAILGIAALRRDHMVGIYALPIAVVGLGLSVYHYQLQMFPGQGSACDASAPCTFQFVDTFGFVSIPFMAGCGFVAIIGLVGTALRWELDERRDPSAGEPGPDRQSDPSVPTPETPHEVLT